MRVAALILAVAILVSGALVALAIDRASGKTITVQITTCGSSGSIYGRRC